MKPNEFLFESKVAKDPIFEDAYRGGRLMIEAALTADQIKQVFASVETGAKATGGANRTMLGKGADAASAVNQAFEKVKGAISKSGPVAGFDASVDKIQQKLIAASGGDKGAVTQAVLKYRAFAKEHPIMQGAIYAGLIALAGITGAGLGGAAILAGIKVFDRLLQGDKASSALWKGFKTGAMAYGAAQLGNYIKGGDQASNINTDGADTAAIPANTDGAEGVTNYYGSDVQNYSVQPGDTLSDIAKANNVSVKDLMDLNTHITNPDALRVGTEIQIPSANYDPTYFQDVGTAKDTASQVAKGAYSSYNDALQQQAGMNGIPPQTPVPANAEFAPDTTQTAPQVDTSNFSGTLIAGQPVIPGQALSQAQISAMKMAMSMGNTYPPEIMAQFNAQVGQRLTQSYERKGKAIKEYIDRSATIQTWALNESLGRPRGGIQLTEAGVARVLTVISEGPLWDKIKSGAAKASSAVTNTVKTGWDDATNKVTANRLDVNWRKGAGKDIAKDGTVDSEVLVQFLKGEGVTDDIISAAFAELGIPTGAEAQQQQTQPAAGTGVFADPQALAASFEKYMADGGKIAPAMRGVLKDILATAMSKVESKKVKGRKI